MHDLVARSSILEIDHLRFGYPDQPALFDDWSARIPAGLTLIHGDSGTGKTTLLTLLAAEAPAGSAPGTPLQGECRLAGVALDADPLAYRRLLYWQAPASTAFDALTVRQYAAEVADEAGRWPVASPDDAFASSPSVAVTPFDDAAFERHLEGFGLLPHADKPLYMLSTGSKRKVWMAVGFACGRRLLLLDEPNAALDAASIGYLNGLLAEAAVDAERAVVVASYSPLDKVRPTQVIELG